MKARYIFSALCMAALAATSCTDLDETLYDKVTLESFGNPEVAVESNVTSAYASLRGYGSGTDEGNGVNCYPTCEYVFFTTECSSDEACIPTRGTDWYDGGRYQEMQFHSWTPANTGVLSLWRYNFVGVSKINSIMNQIELTDIPEEAKTGAIAELRALRAYYYYNLLDNFGNVPIVSDFNTAELPKNSSRKEVFTFVEKELLEVIPQLKSDVLYGRFTQNVAYTLLARLYLNAEVFTGTPRWQDCLDACNKVKGYSLASNYKQNFFIENEKSPEIIFAIQYDHAQGTVGNYLGSMSYHYNQKLAFSPTGNWQWSGNGICAQPGIFSSYEEGDVRRDLSILSGQQKSAADGSDVLMDDGSPLNYTEEIVNYVDAKQNEGVRLDKYEWSVDDAWERDNDWVLMRYAEILMMQAEASFRLGYEGAALGYINQIRQRAHLPALTSLTLNDLDNEWKHEFVFEGLRRNVNIRFGTYFQPWWAKGDSYAKDNGYPIVDESDHHTAIYPIPQEEMQKNPNLVQNPGY